MDRTTGCDTYTYSWFEKRTGFIVGSFAIHVLYASAAELIQHFHVGA